MRIVYLPCHSILEYDELRLLTSLGHEVASLGAYIDPANPAEGYRPALTGVPGQPLVRQAVDMLGQPGHDAHGRCDGVVAHHDNLRASKDDLPDAVIDWADAIIVAGFEHTWLAPQWSRIRDKRVIWRTIGQSGDRNEMQMAPIVADGCEVVRYSPHERFIPSYAGESTTIRFAKDPADWHGWTGDEAVVLNVSQGLYKRSLADDGGLQAFGYQWTSYQFWDEATRGLPRKPAGPGSETHGGLGPIDYEPMRAQLRRCRAYVSTGTQPASYTLGFMEAMLTGIPTVAIGPAWYRILPYGYKLYEADRLALLGVDDPAVAHAALERLLADRPFADDWSLRQRDRALHLFDVAGRRREWQDFLGAAVPTRELVTA